MRLSNNNYPKDIKNREKANKTFARNLTTEINFELDEKDSFTFTIVVLLAIIILVGVFGNILNIIVFSKRNMRQASTFRFLLYLSIADLLVLAVCATDALARFGYQFDIRSYSAVFCRVHTFFTYFLTHISSVILMVISVDRALVVTNKTFRTLFSFNKGRSNMTKFKYREYKLDLSESNRPSIINLPFAYSFTRKLHRVDYVMIIIVILVSLLNSHYFIFLNLNLVAESSAHFDDFKIFPGLNSSSLTNRTLINFDLVFKKFNSKKIIETFYICFPIEGTFYNYFLNNIWIWIDICVYSMIPFIIMSICSLIILARIHSKSKKYFTKLINKNNQYCKTNFYKRLRRNRQLLYMLLITNLYFLLSLMPYCITFVLFKGQKGKNTLGQLSVHILLYTNNAVNFLFYGLSSQKYRQELYSIFLKGRKGENFGNSLVPV